MTEQQYRVIADRDALIRHYAECIRKGDDPEVVLRVALAGIERPVPTTDAPVMLTYEGCKTYPLGTVAADASGYWAAHHRHYVKTSENTWASFWQTPTVEQIAEAVKEERNNLSPCPSGYLAWVTTPLSNEQPSPSLPTREQIAEAIWNARDRQVWAWSEIPDYRRAPYRRMADAVLALLQKGADR